MWYLNAKFAIWRNGKASDWWWGSRQVNAIIIHLVSIGPPSLPSSLHGRTWANNTLKFSIRHRKLVFLADNDVCHCADSNGSCCTMRNESLNLFGKSMICFLWVMTNLFYICSVWNWGRSRFLCSDAHLSAWALVPHKKYIHYHKINSSISSQELRQPTTA